MRQDDDFTAVTGLPRWVKAIGSGPFTMMGGETWTTVCFMG